MDGIIGTDVELAAGLLRSGKPVGMPTETVYGLAANGLNPDAVAQIFEIKNRPFFDPLILHVASIDQAKQFTHSWSQEAETLATHFWPGPLTLVLPKNNNVPDIVSSGNPTVAIRIPNHPVALTLLKSLDFPLAAPSANPFGYVSPTTATHVFKQLGDKITYILDGGACEAGLESTIVACLPNEKPKILRLGSLSIQDITSVLGKIDESLTQNSNPSAPGQLDQHYSPYCKLFPLESNAIIPTPLSIHEKLAVLCFSSSEGTKKPTLNTLFDNDVFLINEGIHGENELSKTTSLIKKQVDVFYLTKNSDTREAAHNLFSMLRRFDELGYTHVWFEWAPEAGLGRAINDRLKRAAAKR